MSLVKRWSAELDRLRELGRERAVTLSDGVDFTSNDYLAYASRPTVDIPAGLSISGRSSRLLAGHYPIWDQVEQRLATWHGSEAALMMTSGYTANEGLLSTIISPGDWVATDVYNHASIGDGIRLSRPRKHIFRHNDLEYLETGLRAEGATRRADRAMFIITESLFSMDGDRAPLLDMAKLAEKYGAYLIVDEAHATGCFGPGGSGLVDELGLRNRVLATVHTGGKALGVPGAYICCSKLLRDYLVNRCRHLIFTTALPPIVGVWWLAALDCVRGDDPSRQRLHNNSSRFRASLTELGVPALGSEYIVPIVIGEDARAVSVAKHLQECGFDVRAVRPPTVPDGTARIRISIHADHDLETLRELASSIHEALET